MKTFRQCRLYTFIDTAYLGNRSAESVARELCAGGSDLIQLRAKNASADAVRSLAETVLEVTSAAGIGLVINDHPEVARQLGACACHLGQEDFFGAGFTQATQVTGSPPGLGLGLSSHEPEQARRALQAGPDYLGVGPVYATATKPGARPVTLDYVRWSAANVPVPWFAIGGIKLDNLDEVLAAGARRIGVVSAILTAPDLAKACHLFKERLLSAPLHQSEIQTEHSKPHP